MERDLPFVGRIVEQLDGRIATHPDEFLISLRRNIELWRKEIYRCWLLELPADILVTIFMNFSPSHVWKLRVICKAFKAAAESEGLWRDYCERFIDTSDPAMCASQSFPICIASLSCVCSRLDLASHAPFPSC